MVQRKALVILKKTTANNEVVILFIYFCAVKKFALPIFVNIYTVHCKHSYQDCPGLAASTKDTLCFCTLNIARAEWI